jgi:hypothetical protein
MKDLPKPLHRAFLNPMLLASFVYACYQLVFQVATIARFDYGYRPELK